MPSFAAAAMLHQIRHAMAAITPRPRYCHIRHIFAIAFADIITPLLAAFRFADDAAAIALRFAISYAMMLLPPLIDDTHADCCQLPLH